MISIHFETENVDQARAAMRTLLFGDVVVAPTPDATAPVAEPEIIPPAKRTRRKKPEEEAGVTDIDSNGDPVTETPAPEVEAALDAAKAETAPEVTKDDIKAAIKKLNTAKGEDACWTLLKKYGAKNVSGVFDTGRGAEFVADADAAIAAK